VKAIMDSNLRTFVKLKENNQRKDYFFILPEKINSVNFLYFSERKKTFIRKTNFLDKINSGNPPYFSFWTFIFVHFEIYRDFPRKSLE
jgi:hypothetical protein